MILAINFGIKQIFLLIFGLFIGIVWGAYVFIKKKRQLIMSHINVKYDILDDTIKKQINEKINNMEKYHVLSRKNKYQFFFGLITINKKVNYEELSLKYLGQHTENNAPLSLVKEIEYLITEVAKIYYPDSNYPLYELTISETNKLITELISLFSFIILDLGIPNLEKLKISTILELTKTTGQIVKITKYKSVKITIGLLKMCIKIQSVITPIYWVKKGSSALTITSLSQFLIKCLFEICAKETACIYSEQSIE